MKCTIKNLAEELNLSRNTVSKALNNSNEVSVKTRQLVLKKAKELNYTNIDFAVTSDNDSVASAVNHGSILFLTRTFAPDSEFWTTVLKGIETVLSNSNYHLVIGIMSENDLKNLEFPASMRDPSIKGIIIVEICDEAVCEALLKHHLPVVTVDMPRNHARFIGKLDVITMENKINVQCITTQLIEKGAKRFGFVGDIFSKNVGRGFQERYDSLCECLSRHHLTLDQECSLMHETTDEFRDFQFIVRKLKDMTSLPDVFLCGNDWTAIQLLYALQFLGYQIPKDVSVVGFDNIPASQRITPALTTIHTPKNYLGIAAARQILERIQYPDSPCVYAEYATELLIRKSTI